MVQRRDGFTLIELLVVIAIISLLVSILLPSLQKAKELANNVVCLNNEKNIGLGINAYLSDTEGFYPQQTSTNTSGGWLPLETNTWWGCIAPYIGWDKCVVGENAALDTIGHCPIHTERPGNFSYTGQKYVFTNPTTSAVNMSNIQSFSETYIVDETHTHSQWPNTSNPWSFGKSPFWPMGVGRGVHLDDMFNFLFCDGHVETLADDEDGVGKLKWEPES